MIKTKVAFLKGQFLSSQSEQFKKYSKSSDWLEKSRPSNKATFALQKIGARKSKMFLGVILNTMLEMPSRPLLLLEFSVAIAPLTSMR